MRYPKFLKNGDTIGFAAPSFGCNIEPYRSGFDNAQKVLEQKGYRLMCGPNVYAGDGIGISTNPENCGREFTEMMLSPEPAAVISCGGGELMCEILRYVNFEAIGEASPKWFMGYSDNTNLTFLLTTLCDTAAIYGPCAPALGMRPWHPAVEDAYRLLRGEKLENAGYPAYEINPEKSEECPLEPYHCTEKRKIIACTQGKTGFAEDSGEKIHFSGRLIGGCLDVLTALCGTQYDRVQDFTGRYREDGFVWFLEACDLSVFGIRRAVWQLKNAGWFRSVRGFLIGRPWAGQQDSMGLDHIRAVSDVLAELEVPVLLDVDIGHLPPMIPLISGCLAEICYDPGKDDFRIKMNLK